MSLVYEEKNLNISDVDRLELHELCKNYLGGDWARIEQDQLIIKPVPHGLVNKLFICFLPDHCNTKYNKVVVRYIDFEALKGLLFPTHITAITLIVSNNGISPKVLSFFSGGTINEYIEGRYFDANDDLNDKAVQKLAEKVAKMHSLDFPISKDMVDWTNDLVFNKWFDDNLKTSWKEGVVREEIKKHKYPIMSKYPVDLNEEFDWLIRTMKSLNSPIVMSHNDLNRRNILVREDDESKEMDIFLIDFDWANYNWRGLDISQYFAFYRQKESDFGYVEFPSDEKMSVFIDAYIEGMTKTFGESYAKQEINSRQQLIKEAKVFALFSHIKDIQYLISVPSMSENKELMVKAEERFLCYDELKTRILNEYDDIKP